MHQRRLALTVLFALLPIAVAGSALAATGASGRTRYVDDDGHAGSAGCSGAGFAFQKIQTAIDMSGVGDTVVVCPGVYVGPVVINGPTHDGLTIRSAVPGKAVLRAPVAFETGATQAILHIASVSDVRLLDFKLVTPTSAPCATVYAAIIVSGSEGIVVRGNRVRAVGTHTLSGACGLLYGIFASAYYAPTSVTIRGNVVRDFRYTGIQADGDTKLVTATVVDNDLQYWHSQEAASVNGATGILMQADVVAHVRGNRIVGLASAAPSGIGTPLLSKGINICCHMASAPDDSAIVASNVVQFADHGIDLSVSGFVVSDNHVSEVAQGITLRGGTSGEVRTNVVTASTGEGIQVTAHTSGIAIHDNDFRGNAGNDCVDLSVGGGTAGTADTWISDLGDESTPATICAPAP